MYIRGKYIYIYIYMYVDANSIGFKTLIPAYVMIRMGFKWYPLKTRANSI